MQSHPTERAPRQSPSVHVLACLLPLLLFPLLAAGLWGGGLWLLLPIGFLMVVVPMMDMLTGWQDNQHFVKADFSPLQLTLLHWNTRLYALLHMTAILYIALTIARYTPLELGLLVGCVSLLGGIAFAAAHELLHGKEKIDQRVQRLLTTFLFYPHYKLIHIRSHHIHAGTEHDENTAWLNESIYGYLFRTIPGSAIRSWQIEARLQRSKAGATGWQQFRQNQMTAFALGQIALLVGLFLLAGGWGLLFYLAQMLGSHIVLESVNYIQHYGLLRQQSNGEYEKTSAEHSWDTYHYFSSYITFRVGHHSYHHIAVQPYYLLATEPEAPKLPVGYFWAIPVVMLPPWWRSVTHPKLAAVASSL